MPFYDEFDLSTVDVLLISQYVYASSASQSGWKEMAHHCSRREHAQSALPKSAPCISESMEYYLHSIHPTPVMCLPLHPTVHQPPE